MEQQKFFETEKLDKHLFKVFEHNYLNTVSPNVKNYTYFYLTHLNLYTGIPQMVYIYSNNSRKESPFYYDILKISSGITFPVYIPVPILAERILKYVLPNDDDLRSEPEERLLIVAYMLREYGFNFDIEEIISKKKYTSLALPKIKKSEFWSIYGDNQRTLIRYAKKSLSILKNKSI